MPKLSVLFPIRNRTKYLAKSIGSVLGCLGELPPDWEIELLAGDNASARVLEPVIRDISPDITVLRWREDLGIFGNMNALIANSTGDWCHIMHDDDWILDGFYDCFAAAVADRHESEIVSIGARLWREADDTTAAHAPWFDESGIVEPRELLSKLHGGNPFSICGMVVSRKAYHRVGLYREDLLHAGDWDMWKRLAASVPWYWCAELLARYRIHDGSATSRYQQDGQTAVDIRRSIESTKVGIDTMEAYRTGSLCWARQMLGDAVRQLNEDNPNLARITVEEALKILSLFG
jgi:glycosyltransferase involved in cell wall biosynthesis